MRTLGASAIILCVFLVSCASGMKTIKDTFPHSCKVKCHDAYPDDLYRQNQCSEDCEPPSD